jgi:hypothetical protein
MTISYLLTCACLVAHWKLDEPVIDGFGITRDAALANAKHFGSLHGGLSPDVDVYHQLPGIMGVWQSRAGKRIEIHHLLTRTNGKE